jgi:hypothetical protein
MSNLLLVYNGADKSRTIGWEILREYPVLKSLGISYKYNLRFIYIIIFSINFVGLVACQF